MSKDSPPQGRPTDLAHTAAEGGSAATVADRLELLRRTEATKKADKLAAESATMDPAIHRLYREWKGDPPDRPGQVEPAPGSETWLDVVDQSTGTSRREILDARAAWKAEGQKSTAIPVRLHLTDPTLRRVRRRLDLLPWPED